LELLDLVVIGFDLFLGIQDLLVSDYTQSIK